MLACVVTMPVAQPDKSLRVARVPAMWGLPFPRWLSSDDFDGALRSTSIFVVSHPTGAPSLPAHMVSHTIKSSSSPLQAPPAPGSASSNPFTDRAILHAIRHHERALEALQEGSFDGLSTPTSGRLIKRLTRDLERLEAELDRRTKRFGSSGEE